MKNSFLKVPGVLFRVLYSTQLVLQISPNTLCPKIKIQKIIALRSFQIIMIRTCIDPLEIIIFKYCWCSKLALGSRKNVTRNFMFSNVSTQIEVLISEFISIKIQGKKLKKLPVWRVKHCDTKWYEKIARMRL